MVSMVRVALPTCITGYSMPRSPHSRVRHMLFASSTSPNGRSVQQSGSPRIPTRDAPPETVPLAKPLEKASSACQAPHHEARHGSVYEHASPLAQSLS